MKDTIVSFITPYGKSAVALLRISGNKCKYIINKFLIFKRKKKIKANKVYLCNLHNKGNVIDNVIMYYFKKPFSYTGEDVIEISCHGSIYIKNKILKLLINEKNIRLSRAGEFTFRAFINNKIDIIQAKGICNIISSHSKKSHELAYKQMSGNLSNIINSIMNDILDILTELEFKINLEDENNEKINFNIDKIIILNKKIKKLILFFKNEVIYNKGIKVVIIGKTNVGKSTLSNKIFGKNKSIVSQYNGTTRDYIENNMYLNQIPITIFDTAGFSNTKNKLEKI